MRNFNRPVLVSLLIVQLGLAPLGAAADPLISPDDEQQVLNLQNQTNNQLDDIFGQLAAGGWEFFDTDKNALHTTGLTTAIAKGNELLAVSPYFDDVQARVGVKYSLVHLSEKGATITIRILDSTFTKEIDARQVEIKGTSDDEAKDNFLRVRRTLKVLAAATRARKKELASSKLKKFVEKGIAALPAAAQPKLEQKLDENGPLAVGLYVVSIAAIAVIITSGAIANLAKNGPTRRTAGFFMIGAGIAWIWTVVGSTYAAKLFKSANPNPGGSR